MKINSKRKNIKKILVILALLVSCYSLFNVSYHLISGTGKATASIANELTKEEEEELFHATEPGILELLLTQYKALRDLVSDATHVSIGTVVNAKGKKQHHLVITGDTVIRITIDSNGNIIQHAHAPKNINDWYFQNYIVTDKLDNATNSQIPEGETVLRFRKKEGAEARSRFRDVGSTSEFILHSSSAREAITSGIFNLPPNSRQKLVNDMIAHPESAAIMTVRIDPVTGKEIYTLHIAQYDIRGNITNRNVYYTDQEGRHYVRPLGQSIENGSIVTTDDIMQVISNQLAGKGNIVRNFGLETEFKAALSEAVNAGISRNNLAEVMRLSDLAKKELNDPSIVSNQVKVAAQDMLDKAKTEQEVKTAILFDGFGGNVLNRGPVAKKLGAKVISAVKSVGSTAKETAAIINALKSLGQVGTLAIARMKANVPDSIFDGTIGISQIPAWIKMWHGFDGLNLKDRRWGIVDALRHRARWSNNEASAQQYLQYMEIVAGLPNL